MAFIPTFSVIEATGSLSATFIDSAAWGSGTNPLKSAVTAASLIISMPDPVTLLPDTSNQNVVDMFARSYPNATNITLLPTDYLQPDDTTKISDGDYQYDLSVVTDDPLNPFTYTWYGTFYKIAECCASAFSNVLACKCSDCLTPKQIALLKMRLDFYTINLSDRYCQDFFANSIALKDAQDICSRKRCKNCNC